MKHFNLKSALFLAVGLLSSGASAQEEDERPNILFCMADDWSWPHAGAYGDEVVETPNFDQVAENGVLFQHTYVTSPSSSPSRNSMITGEHFYRLGQGANLHSTLDTKHPNFMMLLREAGYKIGHIDKSWGPGNFRAGGYDEHPCGPEVKFDTFMEEKPEKEPFCYWLGTSDPHRPYPDGYGDVPYEEVNVPEYLPDVDTVKKDIASYYYEVQRWDQRVGNAIETLKENGEYENTIIVLSGDNGLPFPRSKGNLYDYGTRVPLAIQWAEEVEGGREVTDFVSFTDFAPTFLDAAGIPVPTQMTGKSLLPVLQSGESGRVNPRRNFVVTGRERHTPAQEEPSMAGYPSRAIRTDGWLYIMNLRPHRWPAGVPENATHPMNEFADCDDSPTKFFIMNNKNTEGFEKYYEWSFAKRPAEELYNVRNDPYQLNNLAGDNDYHEVLLSMRNKLINYLRKTEDPRFTDEVPKFNEYPYRTGYLDKEKLREMKEEQTKDKRTEPPFK